MSWRTAFGYSRPWRRAARRIGWLAAPEARAIVIRGFKNLIREG